MSSSLEIVQQEDEVFFKRYLAFEEQYGNEATVMAVKEKALAYVKSVTQLIINILSSLYKYNNNQKQLIIPM